MTSPVSKPSTVTMTDPAYACNDQRTGHQVVADRAALGLPEIKRNPPGCNTELTVYSLVVSVVAFRRDFCLVCGRSLVPLRLVSTGGCADPRINLGVFFAVSGKRPLRIAAIAPTSHHLFGLSGGLL
jgi:hypothetical protein